MSEHLLLESHVPASRIDAVDEAVQRLDRHARDTGIGSIALERLDETVRFWSITHLDADGLDPTPRRQRIPAVKVRLYGPRPEADGMVVLARIDRQADRGQQLTATPGAYPLLKSLGMHKPPKGGWPDHCEHCGTRRGRRHFYLLLQSRPVRRVHQIGKNCLEAAVGADHARAMLATLEVTEAAAAAVANEHVIDNRVADTPDRVVSPEWVLAACASVQRRYGFVAETKARESLLAVSSAGRVRAWARTTDALAPPEEVFTPSDLDVAREVLHSGREGELRERVSSQKASPFETIVHDQLAEHEVAVDRVAGYFAATVNHHRRERLAQLPPSPGVIGTKGEVVTLAVQRAYVVCQIDTQAVHYLHVFLDADGRRVFWAAIETIDADQVTIRGRVHQHTTYRGEPQTVLKDVTVVDTPAASAAS